MKLEYVKDPRIAEDAAFQVAECPNYAGLFGVIDTDFMELVADGFDYEQVVQLAIEKNRNWNNFLDDLIG